MNLRPLLAPAGLAAFLLIGAAAQPTDPAPAGAPAAAAAPAQPANHDPFKEPPLELDLDVAGKVHAIQLDKPFEVQIDGKKVPMKLTAKPWRTFRYVSKGHGFEFRYPTTHGFEGEKLSGGAASWSFDGNDTVLMITRFPAGDPVELRQLVVDNTAQAFEGATIERRETTLRLGGQEFKGLRLNVTLVTQFLRQDFYAIPLGDEGGIVMTLQDSPGEPGGTSTEMKDLAKLLEQSFKLIKPQ